MYSPQTPENTAFELGHRYYELSNHLGNVLTVISDVKTPVSSGGNVASYTANIVNISDYSPFGVQLNGRTVTSDRYRYGFNGMESDDEVKGNGNSYDFGARMLDPRVGRWLSIDRLNYKKPCLSTYQSMKNNPVLYKDPDGNDELITILITDKRTGEIIKYSFKFSDRIMTDGKGSPSFHSNFYYDFEHLIIGSRDENGKTMIESVHVNHILKGNGLKDVDAAFGSVNTKGKFHTKAKSDGFLWLYTKDVVLDGEGDSQKAGFSLTTKDKFGDPVKQDAGDSEDVNIDGLSTSLGDLDKGGLGIVEEIISRADKIVDVKLHLTTITENSPISSANNRVGSTTETSVIDLKREKLYDLYPLAEYQYTDKDGNRHYKATKVVEYKASRATSEKTSSN